MFKIRNGSPRLTKHGLPLYIYVLCCAMRVYTKRYIKLFTAFIMPKKGLFCIVVGTCVNMVLRPNFGTPHIILPLSFRKCMKNMGIRVSAYLILHTHTHTHTQIEKTKEQAEFLYLDFKFLCPCPLVHYPLCTV